jgi:DNA-binding SARP family transcriptional activator
MLYRLLGPLEVRRDGEPLSFSPRQRIVLSMLLVEPNRVVAVDRLVDSVWDATPPSTAKEQIRICVSSIRRKLIAGGVPNTIVTRPPGYSIRCTKENLDLLVFESLVSSGRADAVRHRYAEAADAFGRALALWRGRPLAGVNSQLIESIGVGFDERRLAVTEEYVAAQLRLGDQQEPARQHELISELAELVTANPFREQLRAQLMIALHRAGRRAEALETYRSGRQLFVEKLGLEPGRELLHIEQAILRGDNETVLAPAPNHTRAPATTAGPHLLPADAGDFVGRTDLVERTRNALSDQRTGSRTIRLVAVHGGPWLGKTSLVVHAAHLMSDEFPDGQLFVQLGGSRRTVAPCEVLRRFLGALGVQVPTIPDSLEERAEMYRNIIGDRRMLVVLDDVVDEKQVLPLLPGDTGCAVVVTSRVKLTNLPGATFIGVGPMSRPDSVALLTHVLGPDTVLTQSADLGHLAELCADEPLALRLAAARLAGRPHWPVSRLVERMRNDHRHLEELSHGGLDLITTIRQTYDRLGEQAQLLLRRASLLGSVGFTGGVCAPMLDTTEDAADDALAELVNAGLLDVARETNGQVRFHLRGLLRTFARTQFAAEDLSAERITVLRRIFDTESLVPSAVTEETRNNAPETASPTDARRTLLRISRI